MLYREPSHEAGNSFPPTSLVAPGGNMSGKAFFLKQAIARWRPHQADSTVSECLSRAWVSSTSSKWTGYTCAFLLLVLCCCVLWCAHMPASWRDEDSQVAGLAAKSDLSRRRNLDLDLTQSPLPPITQTQFVTQKPPSTLRGGSCMVRRWTGWPSRSNSLIL